MTVIDENTIVVYSDTELKQALEGNNTYTTIYFGNNITLTTGITIAKNKKNVIIDGTYHDAVYTLEDKKSGSTSDTITITSDTKKVIVQNMNIVGYNYYGIIYVPENSLFKDVVVEYNHITYVGPQISYHPVGLTRFIDDDIIIQDQYASGNEVAECNQIEIGGVTTIVHKSSGNSSFWFRNDNPSLTILMDAVVDFTSENRELFYGTNNLSFHIMKNAYFSVTTHNGMGYGNFGTGTTVIDQNARFFLKQTHSNSGATWYSYGNLTLNDNAELSIICDYTGITTSNYNLSFSGSNLSFILNNPNKVLLYNSKANVISTSTTTNFEFHFNRINLFDLAIPIEGDISSSTLPTYAWYQSDSLIHMVGTFNRNSTTITSHNLTEEELQNLPTLSLFIFPIKKIVSIGDFVLHLNALKDTDTVMKGMTKANASLLIEYDGKEEVVLADDEGNFQYTYSDPLPIGTVITLTAKEKDELIYHTKKIQIVYSGELILDSASKMINFYFTPIQTNPILCPRKNTLMITVTDSRANSSDWKLYAVLDHDLISSTGRELKDALVYVDEDGIITPLTTSPTLVYTGKNNEGITKVTTITWNQDKGILLKISDVLENGLEYESTISWILEE